MAPYRCTVTDSPVGRVASTVFSLTVTVGWGIDAPTPIEEGLLLRSIVAIVVIVGVVVVAAAVAA